MSPQVFPQKCYTDKLRFNPQIPIFLRKPLLWPLSITSGFQLKTLPPSKLSQVFPARSYREFGQGNDIREHLQIPKQKGVNVSEKISAINQIIN